MTLTPDSSEGSSRLSDLACLSAVGIILVVFGHSHPMLDLARFEDRSFDLVRAVVYAFHMPLFFYISGYLLRYSLERRDIRPS